MTRSARLAAVAAGVVVAGLTVAVVAHPGPLPGELAYILWLQRRGEPLATAAAVVRHGTSTFANLIVLFAFAVAAVRLLGRPARRAVAVALVAMLAVQPIYKEIVDRPRPDVTQVDVRADHSSRSFPSGHSLGTATVWGAAAGFAWIHGRRRWAVLAAVPVVATGFSSAIQGVHWPSDAVAGTLVGCGAAWLAVTVATSAGPEG